MIPFPARKYQMILADPPWSYENKHTGGSMTSGAADQYPTMQLDDIRALPVPAIADRDSVLALWATVPLLPEALAVLVDWGFTYKTAMFWHKKRDGLGFWFRGEIEMLLIGIRGKVRAFHCQHSNFVESRPRAHSQKPGIVYRLLESTGITPRIELFARERRQGWDAWGNQVPASTQTLLEVESDG